MEGLATAPPPRRPHRERRHRRKASDAAAAALAASSYGDVFGGPPRFAPPPVFADGAGAAPADYAEVFGGVAASCSIPYLDLPPAVTDGVSAGAGGYGEIFGRFDFGDFAAPYEEMLPGAECLMEEIASPSGSSRSSIRKESDKLDTEPSILHQQYPDADQHLDEEQFYPVSFTPDGEQRFNISYNKTTWGRPDDLVEMTTCIVEPSISYVVDSCNLSNDSEMDNIPVTDSGTHANGVKEKMSPPNTVAVSLRNVNSTSVVDRQPHFPTWPPISENICEEESFNKRSSTHSVSSEESPSPNGVKEKMSPLNVVAVSLDGAISSSVVDQQPHTPTCSPSSENICEEESFNKRSSTHSVSSEEAPSPDYPFLRVSDISLPAAPIKVQPPPVPPFKLLNKKGNKEHRDSDVNPNSAAAAAMKEAMEFAEARLKAAKDLMEKKGDSSKFRKRPAHQRSTKSTEIKECKASEEVHLFEENLSMRRLAKEENQNTDVVLPDKNRGGSAIKSGHCDQDKKGVVSPGKPQGMVQNGNELEQLGKWTSDAEFYELVSNDQIYKPIEAACQGNNVLMTNSFTELDQSGKEKAEGFAGEPKRSRKLWGSNNTTGLRMEHVNQGKDIASTEAEQKAPRLPEVPFCAERVTYQQPTKGDNCPLKNSSVKLDQSDKEKPGVVGEPKRSRKLWCSNNTTGLRMEPVIQEKNGVPSVEAEQKVPRLPEVPIWDARVMYQEPTKADNTVTNSSARLDQVDKEKAGGSAGEPKRSRKLWGSNNTTGMRVELVNQGEDGIAFVEAEQKAPRSPEVLFCDERVTYQAPTDSHLKQCPGLGNYQGLSNDGLFEISSINSLPTEVHAEPEMSCSFLEPCLSGGHAENHSDGRAQETPLVRNSSHDSNNKEGLELPCSDELLCTSARSQVVQEFPKIPNTDEIKEALVNISKLDESAKPHEIFEKEKLFNFGDEACQQKEIERANEVTSESLIYEEMAKYGIEKKEDVHAYFQEGEVDQAAGSPEEEGYVTSGSGIANESEYEEAEVDIFVGDSGLMEPNVRTCGTCDNDPYQFQESQGSWEPQNMENMDRVEDIIAHGDEKEAQKSLLENVDNVLVEEVLNHDSKEGQKSGETSVNKRPNSVYTEVNLRSDKDDNPFDSDDSSDYAMNMGTSSNNLQALFSEACTSMKHLSQNTESISAEKADVLKNLDVNCREADRVIPTENCTPLEERQTNGSEVEERDKVTGDIVSETILESREKNLDVQKTKERNDVKETEGEVEKEVLIRLDEEKEKEQDEEKRRRELEKEREMERAKDRLAVQRATREAHERAFAEVRAKAERVALERITSSRQRASAEAHEKEEKTTAQAALEKASREATMKAERAAVERATAEARERAIEKAKAAADAKERRERFRSSLKDSFKAPDQDNQQDAQLQKTVSKNHRKSTDIQVVEVESALRHKAKLERHQRTAERAAKALAEKNMRDMLAQREQAEKHRLAEFLDPEVKRWSNGKEGNLRALLSTLQYILGSDSGWQSVPLTDLITAGGVKKAYRKATLCVHPDKVQQRGATIRQKYICEKVFDLLKEAWNKYNSEER